MKIHEYQAKQMFAAYGIPLQRGVVAKTAEEAKTLYASLKEQVSPNEDFLCNVKAQLHAGGRGKAGGVLVAHSAEEAAEHTKNLVGKILVTHQTGAEGLPVTAVLLDKRMNPEVEMYLAMTIDRFSASPVVLASRTGGMEIEDVAAEDPNAVVSEVFGIIEGPQDDMIDRVAKVLELKEDHQIEDLRKTIKAMWQIFEDADASLIEINPLVLSKEGRLIALDAKVNVDDNALFRHDDIEALRDPTQEDATELKANKLGLSYVGLEGNIGCLVNGAGLAMATNDIIKLSGGEPANFLDVGGGANVEQVTNAFSIILSDDKVKAILVNIFGGIMRCDWIAEGLLKATEKLQVSIPIVVRLQGTNVEEGRNILKQANALNLISVDELGEAARKVVEVANQQGKS